MKTIVRILLALALVAALATPATAGTWKPFLHGVKTPAELADKVQASLSKDLSGKSIIDPERCKRDGSCAKPSDYLKMFQESDPDSNLKEVGQVPGYLRSLEVAPAPAGEYWLACLKPSGDGTYKPVLHCNSRFFKKGETAWVNPRTKRIILASDCTNPVEKPVPPKHECAYIPFTVTQLETIARFGLIGPKPVEETDDCLGLKRVGETEFERWWKDECPEVGCDFTPAALVIDQPVQIYGSIKLLALGEYVLRLPSFVAEKSSLYVTVICLERGSPGEAPKEPPRPVKGTNHETYTAAYDTYMKWREEYAAWREKWLAIHSDGRGVRWSDYLATESGTKEARVYYTEADVPAGKPQLYFTWGEWFRLHPEQLQR